MAANALFQSIYNDVVVLTSRPDLVAETQMAVRAATTKMHLSDHFYKDLVETGVSFEVTQKQQQLEYAEVFPRWRGLKYLRKAELNTSTGLYEGGAFIRVIDPELVLDGYAQQHTDVAYVTGTVVQILSSTAVGKILVGYYSYPDMQLETYDSWIARQVPYAIVYDAAATIFKNIGYDEQAAFMRQDAAIWARELTVAGITA